MADAPAQPRFIVYEPVDDVRYMPGNPKAHDADAIAASIDRQGYIEPIIADDRTGLLVSGHGRCDDLKRRRDYGDPPPDGIVIEDGVWKVPVVHGWASADDDDARAYVIAANELPPLGGWDDRALADWLGELGKAEQGWTGTGFDQDAYDQLLARLEADTAGGRFHFNPGDTGPDEDPIEPPAEPVTRPGDLWILGDHRLLCGDSTQRATYERLLDGARPDMLLTDPPYGVSHGSGVTEAKAIRGDIGQAVIPLFFGCALPVISDDAVVYIFGGSGQAPMYYGLWDHHLHDFPRIVVWVKESFVLRPNHYHSRFELCYWGWKGNGGKVWYGDRSGSDVWHESRDASIDRVHSTQKPARMMERPIGNQCPPGGLVLEPFGGSGSVLIAAERLGRRCFTIEDDPAYVDVICQRWARATGRTPTLQDGGHAFEPSTETTARPDSTAPTDRWQPTAELLGEALPAEAASVIATAIATARDGDDTVAPWRALELIAADYLAGAPPP